MKKNITKIFESFSNVIILSLLILAAVSHSGRFWGKSFEEWQTLNSHEEKIDLPPAPSKEILKQYGYNFVEIEAIDDYSWELSDGTTVLSTQPHSDKIRGFAGSIHLYIFQNNEGVIQAVHSYKQYETPSFMADIEKAGIIKQWQGISADKLEGFKPETLTGATMSSDAINESIMQTMSAGNIESNKWSKLVTIENIAAIFVVLLGAFMSFYAVKRKWLRIIQLSLNVLVLGIWCGKFISLEILFSWFTNGFDFVTGFVVMLMLALGLILPIFFKRNAFYCTWVCPFGAAQELLGKVSKKKVKFNKSTMKILNHSRTFITLLILFSMWVSMGLELAQYEAFTVFLFGRASTAVLVIAILGLASSIFINKPYCRFVCPTGKILDWTKK
jgi:hypothetical protein